MRWVRAIAAWLFTWAFLGPVLLANTLTLRHLPDGWLEAAFQLWGRITLQMIGVELRLDNPCPFLTPAPRVSVSNHQSSLEILWGSAVYPSRLLCIGKKEVKWIPILNLIWWSLGFIFIDRGNTQRALKALRGVAAEINANARTLVVAPEGTRCADGEIGPFKKGAFHIAVEAQVPIFPMVVDGAWQSMPKGSLTAAPGVIRLRFLEPTPTTGLTVEDVPRLMEDVRAQMVAALREMRGEGAAMKEAR